MKNVFDKQIVRKCNESTIEKPKESLPKECKIVLLKEVKRLTKILNRLNRVDKS